MLGAPELWNTIICDSSIASCQKQADFFLSHAGSLPLHIHTFVDNSEDLFSLNDYLPRLRELRISECDVESLELIEEAPLLEYLDIQQKPIEWDALTIAVELPVLFDNNAPRLRYLALDGIISWGDNAFQNLTHLYLSGIPNVVHFQASERQYPRLIALLQASPRLETLTLRSLGLWISKEYNPRITNCGVVKLPCLRRLSIGNAFPGHVAQLLSNLSLPCGVCMSIHDVFTFSVLPADTSCLHILDSITSLRLDLHTDTKSGFATGIGKSGSFHIQTLPLAQLFSEQIVDEDYTWNVLLKQLPSGTSQRLTELWLSGRYNTDDTPLCKTDFRSLFNDLTSLRKLVIIRNHSAPEILVALAPAQAEASNRYSEFDAPCHSLESLWIGDLEKDCWTKTRPQLISCVKGRALTGRRVPEVRLYVQGKTLRGVQSALREYVDVVEHQEFPDTIEGVEWADECLYRGEKVCWPRWKR